MKAAIQPGAAKNPAAPQRSRLLPFWGRYVGPRCAVRRGSQLNPLAPAAPGNGIGMRSYRAPSAGGRRPCLGHRRPSRWAHSGHTGDDTLLCGCASAAPDPKEE